jgi:hypothetical protein
MQAKKLFRRILADSRLSLAIGTGWAVREVYRIRQGLVNLRSIKKGKFTHALLPHARIRRQYKCTIIRFVVYEKVSII